MIVAMITIEICGTFKKSALKPRKTAHAYSRADDFARKCDFFVFIVSRKCYKNPSEKKKKKETRQNGSDSAELLEENRRDFKCLVKSMFARD